MTSGAMKITERSLETSGLRAVFRHLAKVPLTHHVGVVTSLPKQSRKRNDTIRQVVFISRVFITQDSADALPAHAGDVIVVTTQQHGAGGRTHRRRVKLRKQQAFSREGVDIRRRDVTAIAAEIRITQVVRDNQQNVGARVVKHWLNVRIASGDGKNRSQAQADNFRIPQFIQTNPA